MSEAKRSVFPSGRSGKRIKRVKANHGAAGVDEQSIAELRKGLKGTCTRSWNRMSSGQLLSGYPLGRVRTVKIPKRNGGERKLGIPDRIGSDSQQVVEVETGAGG